jgi:hypothetical protein
MLMETAEVRPLSNPFIPSPTRLVDTLPPGLHWKSPRFALLDYYKQCLIEF